MAFHVEDVEEAAAAIKVGHVRHQGGICLFFHFGNPLENYGRCHMCARSLKRTFQPACLEISIKEENTGTQKVM